MITSPTTLSAPPPLWGRVLSLSKGGLRGGRPRRQIVALWLQYSQGEIQIGVKFSPGNGRIFNRPSGSSIRRVQRLALRLAARDGWHCHPTLACGPTDWQEFGWVLHRPR